MSVAALALLALGGCERTTRDTDIKNITVSEVKVLVDRAQNDRDAVALIDPRPAKYYNEAHIPGARNIQLPQIDPRGSMDPSISRAKTIVVYGDDPASATARGMTKRLISVGYDGVRLFAGGMKEWRARGYAVDGSGEPAPETPATPSN